MHTITMRKLKTAIVGYGLSAKVFHLPFLNVSQHYDLKAIVSSQADAIHTAFPSVNVYSQIENLIDNEQLDLIIITTPNHLHYSQSKLALERGLHVVTEKPFCPNSTEAEELIKLAASKGLFICPFQNRRYDDDFITIQKLVKNGDLGEILYMESNFDRFRPKIVNPSWREQKDTVAGGVLFDLGAHLIDQSLALFGLPTSFDGEVGAQRSGAVQDDFFRVNLSYGKLKVALGSCSVAAQARSRFIVFGSKGSFKSTGLDPQEAAIKKNYQAYHSQERRTWTFADGEGTQKLPMEKGDYGLFYQDIFSAIQDGKQLIPKEQILENLKIINSLLKA